MSITKEKKYTVESYEKSQLIFNEGDESQCAYLVQEGCVEIYRIDNNNHVVVNIIKKGELFGEMGIISSAPRVANARATEDTRLIKFNKADILNDLKNSPQIVNALTHLLIKRFTILDNELREVRVKDILLKVAELLDMMAGPENDSHSVSYQEISQRSKSILDISKFEVDNALTILQKLTLINVLKNNSSTDIWNEKTVIEIIKPKEFLSATRLYYDSMRKKEKEKGIGELAYIDISEVASLLEVTSKRVLTLICSGEIPRDLLYLHKESVQTWINSKSKVHFSK